MAEMFDEMQSEIDRLKAEKTCAPSDLMPFQIEEME